MSDPLTPLLPSSAALQTPLIGVDAAGLVRFLNPAAAIWLGSGLRRLLSQPLARIAVDPEQIDALCRRARAHVDGVRAQRIGWLGADGEPRFAHVLASPTSDAEWVWLELHPTEEFPGEDPATRLPAALAIALKGLAHEVKNPLAGLKGAAQLLRRRVNDSDSLRYLDVILSETERLAALMQRLLDPKPQHPLAPTNVHEALERVRLLAEAEAGWAKRIVRDYDPSLPEIPADADRLTQALWNLVRNALQAEATEVRLRTRAENAVMIGTRVHRLALRIEVVDNGRGVPESLADNIFLPLVSGRAEGTGLGLALAQQVAHEHAGSLSYRSRRGHTVFTLLLPAGT